VKGGRAVNSNEMQPLIQEKLKMIFKYLIKIGAEPTDAEDIVQETVYKFFLNIEVIEPKKASSWLFRVAVNHYFDICRKRKREILITVDDSDFKDESILPEEVVLHKENNKEIERVLNQMKPLYKNLLILKYSVGLSYQEIAETLDIKIGTLKTYLFRARENFKLLYGREPK
jgi:RNA polymerase sigma factor (sigma-70 family)